MGVGRHPPGGATGGRRLKSVVGGNRPPLTASSRLTIEIGGPFDRGRGGPGGWWIIDEPELHLGEDILVPDLAG